MNLKASFNRLLGINDESNSPRFFEWTDIGHRKMNQDFSAHLSTKKGILLVVADGLGGHQGGELASRFFCEALISLADKDINKLHKKPEESLKNLAIQASEAMSSQLKQNHPGIDAHTTCVVCWVSLPDNKLTTLHIGDSRIYRFKSERISWRSRDHSVVQMLVDTGQLKEEEMGTHPQQGALTRSIGVGKAIKPSVKTHKDALQKGEALLLCSDGLWEMISTKEICSLAKQNKPQKRLEKLVATAVKRAAPRSDNVTAQVLIF